MYIKRHAEKTVQELARMFGAVLDRMPGTGRGSGGVVCLYDQLITWQGTDKVIPINYL